MCEHERPFCFGGMSSGKRPDCQRGKSFGCVDFAVETMRLSERDRCLKCGEARRKLLELSLSLIIINMPLPDESGVHFAVSCAETTSAGVLATAPAVQAGELSDRLERCGVFVLEKPLSRSSFMQAVRLLSLSQRRVSALQKKNAELLQKLDDTRLACRAKCLLVERLKLTEDEAHHVLERRAMDLRISRREAALAVIRQYDSAGAENH